MMKTYKEKLSGILKNHFEWIALAAGLIALGLMNPYIDNGTSWCLFEAVNAPYCPGEGMGHSIALTFRGDFANALEANAMGPISIIILSSRIFYLLNMKLHNPN